MGEKSAKRKKEREGVNRQGEKVQELPWCDHDDDGRGQEFCFGDCAEDEESYSCPSGYKIVHYFGGCKTSLVLTIAALGHIGVKKILFVAENNSLDKLAWREEMASPEKQNKNK